VHPCLRPVAGQHSKLCGADGHEFDLGGVTPLLGHGKGTRQILSPSIPVAFVPVVFADVVQCPAQAVEIAHGLRVCESKQSKGALRVARV